MVLGLLAAAAGCAGPLNTETALGGTVELSALNPQPRVSRPPETYTPPAPSLHGIARDNWHGMVLLVPVDGPEHYAMSSVHPHFTDQNVRQGPGYPTEDSALELANGMSVWQQTLEAIAEPFYSGLDIIMAVPRAIFDPPWEVQRSPREAMERGPAGDKPAGVTTLNSTAPAASVAPVPPASGPTP